MKITLLDPSKGTPIFNAMSDLFCEQYKPDTFSEEMRLIQIAEAVRPMSLEFMKRNSDIDESKIVFNSLRILNEEILVDGKPMTQKLIKVFGSYIGEIHGLAVIKYIENGGGYKRMGIPPLSAFDYISHNKMNITDSGLTAAILHD